MLKRDYLLKNSGRFFEEIAKALRALEQNKITEVEDYVRAYREDALLEAFMQDPSEVYTEDELHYLSAQGDLLWLELQVLLKKDEPVRQIAGKYTAFAEKLLKADQRNFNFDLFQKMKGVKKLVAGNE